MGPKEMGSSAVLESASVNPVLSYREVVSQMRSSKPKFILSSDRN